jgi:hypothetical protein
MLNTGRFEDREAGCEAIWELIDFLPGARRASPAVSLSNIR